MNAKRVKRLRKELRIRGTPATDVVYEGDHLFNKPVELKQHCGRRRYKDVKKMYKRFGL